jgi:hypothetical protein
MMTMMAMKSTDDRRRSSFSSMTEMMAEMPAANGSDPVWSRLPLRSINSSTDALAASPFALLDARNCLRLVTDAVHEDDALCLALACRALRDALGERFPACPRAGGRAVASRAANLTGQGGWPAPLGLAIP